MPANQDPRKWWQRPETIGAFAALITALATFIAVLTGNGNGPA